MTDRRREWLATHAAVLTGILSDHEAGYRQEGEERPDVFVRMAATAGQITDLALAEADNRFPTTDPQQRFEPEGMIAVESPYPAFLSDVAKLVGAARQTLEWSEADGVRAVAITQGIFASLRAALAPFAKGSAE